MYYRVLPFSQIQEIYTSAKAKFNQTSGLRVGSDLSGAGIHIELPENQPEGAFEVLDNLGRVVQKREIRSGKTYLSTAHWPSGLYLFRTPNQPAVKWWKE